MVIIPMMISYWNYTKTAIKFTKLLNIVKFFDEWFPIHRNTFAVVISPWNGDRINVLCVLLAVWELCVHVGLIMTLLSRGRANDNALIMPARCPSKQVVSYPTAIKASLFNHQLNWRSMQKKKKKKKKKTTIETNQKF